MDTKWVGRTLVRMDVVDSTNETAKEYASQGAESGTLIVAERQTAGKGRRGRGWEGTAGESLLMSVLLRPPVTPEQSAMLTLVTALAVCRALEWQKDQVLLSAAMAGQETGEFVPQIKWPNDVILGTRKVCGILTELIFDRKDSFSVIIGVGVNVNNQYFSEELAEKATSLRREWGQTIDREALMERIWQEFEKGYEVFLTAGDMRPLKREYEKRLVNAGRPAQVFFEGENLCGTARGVDEKGRLILDMPDGRQTAVDAGEVSVRGIYGYV